ncbi:MAG: protein kinase [Candidatus Obscuribacter sp.]|nr:protein kinase [Candidatus Obscuribacter sp.]
MDNDDSTYILEDEPEEPGRVDLSALPVAQPVVQKPRRLGSFPLPNSVPTERPPGASSDGSWQGNEPELAGGFVRGEFIDNEYKVIDFMGAGGAGGVYLVEHRRLKQSFALKVLHGSAAASEKKRQRFIREAKLSSRLEHPGIVKICNFGVHGDTTREPCLYYVMQVVPGVTLHQKLSQQAPLPLELAIDVALGLADALSYAHSKGVIHRDIKPANILLTQSSYTPGKPRLLMQPMLLDFGLARSIEEQGESLGLTGTRDIIGTPVYISPEQSRGRTLDPRSDFYSFGVTVFHMVAGCPPLLGSSGMETILLHQEMPAPSVREINPDAQCPDAMERILARCLKKEPADRYQSADELYSDLLAIKKKLYPATMGPPPLAMPSTLGSTGHTTSSKQAGRADQNGNLTGATSARDGTIDSTVNYIDVDLPSDPARPYTLPLMLGLAAVSLVLIGLLSFIVLTGNSKQAVIPKPKQSLLTNTVKDTITHTESDQIKFIASLKELARGIKTGSYLVQSDKAGKTRAYLLPADVPVGQFRYLSPGTGSTVPASLKHGRLMELPAGSYLNLLASPEVMAVPELLNGFDSRAIAYLHVSKQTTGVKRLLDLCSRFTEMVGLDLQRNDLDDGVFEYINKFDKLRFLNLHQTRVTASGVSTLRQLSSLLLLQVGPIEGDCFEFLSKLAPRATLACLEIEGNLLSDQSLAAIARQPNLVTLNLRRCGINTSRLELLKPLSKRLVYLDLQGNALGPEAIDTLSTFKQMRVLVIEPTGWTDQDKDRLAKALPQCLFKSTNDLQRQKSTDEDAY